MQARTRWLGMMLALVLCVVGGYLSAHCQAAPVAQPIAKAGDLATRMNVRGGSAVFDSSLAGPMQWFTALQVVEVDYWTASGDPVSYATLSDPSGPGIVIRLTQPGQVDVLTAAMMNRQRVSVTACKLVKQPLNPINGFFRGEVYLPVLIMCSWQRDPDALK